VRFLTESRGKFTLRYLAEGIWKTPRTGGQSSFAILLLQGVNPLFWWNIRKKHRKIMIIIINMRNLAE
jgi:hypothetical protein